MTHNGGAGDELQRVEDPVARAVLAMARAANHRGEGNHEPGRLLATPPPLPPPASTGELLCRFLLLGKRPKACENFQAQQRSWWRPSRRRSRNGVKHQFSLPNFDTRGLRPGGGILSDLGPATVRKQAGGARAGTTGELRQMMN